MNISEEEKLMYQVMKAIYDSGIPMEFKGSMVLRACLMEAGCLDDIRHTVDIDANWYSESAPTAEQMTDSIQKVLRQNNINLDVRIYRMYGDNRSAGFELFDPQTGEVIFSMDIDVNRPAQLSKVYQVGGIRFRGITPYQMIADKISVVSTEKVFRRIKDVVDLYYLSKVFELDVDKLSEAFSASERQIGNFDGFLHSLPELQHAYDKFRFDGNVDKPPFEEVYRSVKTFIKDILPRERDLDMER